MKTIVDSLKKVIDKQDEYIKESRRILDQMWKNKIIACLFIVFGFSKQCRVLNDLNRDLRRLKGESKR